MSNHVPHYLYFRRRGLRPLAALVASRYAAMLSRQGYPATPSQLRDIEYVFRDALTRSLIYCLECVRGPGHYEPESGFIL